LRERLGDIPMLVRHFESKFTRPGARPLPESVVADFAAQSWPGNVRELRNVVERLMIMVPGEVVTAADLAFLAQGGVAEPRVDVVPDRVVPLHIARDDFEKRYILHTLAAQQGNMSRTADVLGVERSNLYRKMRRFGIAPARRGDDDVEPV